MTFIELHNHIYSGSRAKLTMGLLCYLLDHADETGECEISRDDVMDTLNLGLSRSSSSNLSHSLRELKEGGIVEVMYHRDGVVYEKPGKGIGMSAVISPDVLRLFGK